MNYFELRDTGVVILAAGNSVRMRFPKPLLMYDHNRTFIGKLVEDYNKFGCGEIVIVINKFISRNTEILSLANKYPGLKVVINEYPEYERFYSIKLGLNQLERSTYCYIQNCDNPFIDMRFLGQMYYNKLNDGYVVPTTHGKGGHPILISKRIIDYIKKFPANDANLRDIMVKFNRMDLDLERGETLININTPEEYFKYFKNLV